MLGGKIASVKIASVKIASVPVTHGAPHHEVHLCACRDRVKVGED